MLDKNPHAYKFVTGQSDLYQLHVAPVDARDLLASDSRAPVPSGGSRPHQELATESRFERATREHANHH